MKRRQLDRTNGGDVVSMYRRYCRSIRLAALAFVFALPVATAHGAYVLALPIAPAHGAGSPSPSLAIGAGVQVAVQDSPVSVEDVGSSVMAALQQGSFDVLIPHLPTTEDLQEVIAKLVESGEMTEEQAQQNASQIPGIIEALHASLREDYTQVQAMAAHEGVSWEAADITGYRIDLLDFDTLERREVDTATLATLKAGQMLQANIAVHFAAAGGAHTLSLGPCVRTSRGWVIMERFGWSDGR